MTSLLVRSLQRQRVGFANAVRSNNVMFQASRGFATTEEIAMLEKLLAEARSRETTATEKKDAAAEEAAGPKFNIGTFNAISDAGLKVFPRHRFNIVPMSSDESKDVDIHAILLRSFKLGSPDVPDTVRAIARCGSGTNNIAVADMTERGVPVFNTPGANANAVKELAVCGLLLASRGIVDGIQHMKTIHKEANTFEEAKKRVESDKKMFVGKELTGKKLGVIGLGHIGASVAQTAIALGMEVTGYDPALSLDAAWRLPGDVLTRANSLKQLCEESDYISLHVPYMKETHHLLNGELLKAMKPGCHIVNFARGELVDTASMASLYESGERTGRYIADFADEYLNDHPKVILIPHLGASTAEAEENAAAMAARQIINFIETGTIENSVNFPSAKLDPVSGKNRRLCIVNQNIPGILGLITSTLGRLNVNIIQQLNTSRGDIAYTVVDVDTSVNEDLGAVQEELAKLDGVISSRIISKGGSPGFFHVNSPNK